MAKKKDGLTKRDVKQSARLWAKIRAAWVKAGEPKEGITVDGVHYTPLDFGNEWREARSAKAGK